MTIIWLIVWLLENSPNIFNNTGNDTAWIIALIVCIMCDLNTRTP